MTFGGLRATGREIRDPTGTLVELTNQDNLHHLAIVFESPYREHITLNRSVELVESFLRFPMVLGLAELASWHPKQGAFVYPTGQIWTAEEVLRAARHRGEPLGVRAAVELGILAGQILTEASDIGRVQGCFAHGNICPWRIALKEDGQVMVLGHGLPQMDWLLHLQDKERPLKSESLRYAPPERVEGQPEGLAADIYGLAVVMAEMIMGEPLFGETGLAKLKTAITMSEGEPRVAKRGSGIPKVMRSLLQQALTYDPYSRPSGEAFIEALHQMLNHATVKGPTLFQLMHAHAQEEAAKPGGSKRKLVSEGETRSRQRAAGGTPTSAEGGPAEEKRWKRRSGARRSGDDSLTKTIAIQLSDKPTRARKRKDPEEENPTSTEAAPTSRRRRNQNTDEADNTVARRRRRREEAPATEKAPTPKTSSRKRRRKQEEPESKTAPTRQKRRGKSKAKAKEEASLVPEVELKAPGSQLEEETPKVVQLTAQAEAAPQGSEGTATRRRRRRKDPEATVQAEAAPEASEGTATRRRRRRKDPEATAQAEAAPEASEGTAPRRRRRRKDPEATAQAEAAPEASEGTATRRRRRRKESGEESAGARQKRRGTTEKK